MYPTPFLPNSFNKGCPTPQKGVGVRGVIIPPQIFVWCRIASIWHHIPLTPLIFVVPYWGYSAPRVVPNSPKLAPQKWGGWGGAWCRIASFYNLSYVIVYAQASNYICIASMKTFNTLTFVITMLWEGNLQHFCPIFLSVSRFAFSSKRKSAQKVI